MKDAEFKDREVKIKREIEELCFKPIIVSIGDMDKFDKKEKKKIRPIKKTWYDRLIMFLSLEESVAGFKDKIVRLF